MTDKSSVIFDLTNSKNTYKGILFAELDNNECIKRMEESFPPPPSDYCVGVIGIIWIDEQGVWNAKVTLKLPTGNKQVLSKKYDKEHFMKVNINETYVLNHIYRLPMKKKMWLKNEDGTANGILDLIKKFYMFESLWVEEIK